MCYKVYITLFVAINQVFPSEYIGKSLILSKIYSHTDQKIVFMAAITFLSSFDRKNNG